MRIISGDFRGRTIRSISGPGYRPATGKVRQALFSMVESRGVVWPESCVLDLFAGSGSLGLEAVSRGAAVTWFVEKNKKAAQLIRQNILDLGIRGDCCRVWTKDVFQFLRMKHSVSFDLAFVDPPYGKGLASPVLRAITSLVGPGGYVIAEVESGLHVEQEDFPDLDVEVHRTYGQTRICVWMVRDNE